MINTQETGQFAEAQAAKKKNVKIVKQSLKMYEKFLQNILQGSHFPKVTNHHGHLWFVRKF